MDMKEKVLDIDVWINGFLGKLNDAFQNRVWFVGLQGSYGRGEATYMPLTCEPAIW